jgi:hypothetical protein
LFLANLSHAQRPGLHENPDNSDTLFSCDDLSVIRRELWCGQTLPAAGFLMLVNHRWWTFAPVIGGAAYVDTGGREYSYKVPSFTQMIIRLIREFAVCG